MANWPDSITTLPTALENDVDTVQASHVNVVNDEVTAIMTSLGTNFTGSFTVQTSLWAENHLPTGEHGAVKVNSGMSVTTVLSVGTGLNLDTAAENITHNATSHSVVINAGGFSGVFDTLSSAFPAIRYNRFHVSSFNGRPEMAVYNLTKVPDGATLTEIKAWGLTGTDSDSVTVNLYKTSKVTDITSLMATLTFADGTNNATDSSIATPVVDLSSFAYFVQGYVQSLNGFFSAVLRTVEIFYTTTDMSQT